MRFILCIEIWAFIDFHEMSAKIIDWTIEQKVWNILSSQAFHLISFKSFMTWYIGVLLISMDIVAKRSRQLLFWSEDKLVIDDLFLISNFILKSQFRDSLWRFNLVWCWKLCLLQSLAAWFTVYWQWETEHCQKLYAIRNKTLNCAVKYIKDQWFILYVLS